MNAFETELGVINEIAKAVNDLGWLLPTDIQGDAIPSILGGGDVLMAAETGSGKTGAFCLPVLQIVYETLKDIQENKGAPTAGAVPKSSKFQMNALDRTPAMAIDMDGLLCQSRDEVQWHGCKSNKGVVNRGKYYYEATVTDEGLCRVGWSTTSASHDLGTDNDGFGYGGTGKKSNAKDFKNYGEAYGLNDTIGCFIDLDYMIIKWSKNGVDLGPAFDIPPKFRSCAFYAAVCLKNAEIQFNFGSTPFKFPPRDGCIGFSQAPKDNTVDSKSGSGSDGSKRPSNAPLAIIIEPSKELAEQTLKQIQIFKKYLQSPPVRELLIVGGIAVKDQIQALQDGVEIIVATPGRLDDLISTERLSLKHVRFFILDEVDGLLSQGHKDLIMKIFRMTPSFSYDGKRLQMIVCSATLHNFDVKRLADEIMHFPNWIDLKGQDTVPDTIHHCVCIVDPKQDHSWRSLKRPIQTDGVHSKDRLNFESESKETLSEAVKLLKAEYCLNAINTLKMDRGLIFCRTKLDCDNLENFFISHGGGPNSAAHQYSCVCLHADRSPKERTDNLEKFKQNKVRFLICTDVAARGLDITGLPFVINYTLPDDKQMYIHRIGRVGRAERMGLAVSLVSKVQEKVWYHSCPSRGKSCFNTLLKDESGCCIWYNEMQYLDDIEEHLGVTISQISANMEVPVNEFDGMVVYGEKLKKKASAFQGHVEFLAPTVKELFELEKNSQQNYLNLKYNKVF